MLEDETNNLRFWTWFNLLTYPLKFNDLNGWKMNEGRLSFWGKRPIFRSYLCYIFFFGGGEAKQSKN